MRLIWKTFFVSFGTVFLCTVLLTAIISYREAERSLARLRAEQRLLAVTAASQIESGYAEQIWPFEMLSAIAKEPDFVSWQIVDGDGRVVLADQPVGDTPVSDLLKVSPRSDDPVRVGLPGDTAEFWVVPLRMRTERNAWLFRLGYDTASVQTQIRDIVFTNALAGMSLAVLLVGASLVVMRRVLRPLNAVTVAATQMAQGDLGVSLPPGGTDEIGELVRGFSVMVSRIMERDAKIKEHLDSLEKARGELEQRVELRTRELHRAKAAAEGAAVSVRESDTRMRGIIEYAADAIVTLNEAGAIEVYNPAAARIFGHSPEEVLGNPFQMLLPEGYIIDLATVSLVMAHEGGTTTIGSAGEARGRRKGGTTFPMQFALSQVHLEDKRLFTAIVHDVSERERAAQERADLNRRLVEASRQAGKAETAIDVLHNVGNILTSVNCSAALLARRIGQRRHDALHKVNHLFREHHRDLGRFLSEESRGRLVPAYLEELAKTMDEDQRGMLAELSSLTRDIDHIKEIVAMQQSYARVTVDVREPVGLTELMDDALRIAGVAAVAPDIIVVRDYVAGARAVIDRHKVLQILVNLINNAKQAISATAARRGTLTVRVRVAHGNTIRMEVIDDGIGIERENLVRIFRHGFTTRRDGHGFGLHGGALGAKQMGGTLTAASEGIGRGATFSLVVPCGPLPADAPTHAVASGASTGIAGASIAPPIAAPGAEGSA
jgi:PAS domain S-box-containing protein